MVDYFKSAARMRKDCNRSDHKDRGEDDTAVAINSYRPLLLLGVIEDDGRHNLDEGKENEQCVARIKISSRVMYGNRGSWMSMAKR